MSDLLSRARAFATSAHRSVELPRLHRSQPRPAHLKAVAGLAALVTDDEEVIAAAWLHDLVEGTPTTLEDIVERFGQGVGNLIAELIPVSRPSDGSPTVRNEKDVRRIAASSPRAKIIWLADMIDTARDYERNQGPLTPKLFRDFSDIVDALSDGHERLVARLQTIRSGLEKKIPADHQEETDREERFTMVESQSDPTARIFLDAFKAADIAEPLLSFDESNPADDVAVSLRSAQSGAAGIRQNGRVIGYVLLNDLTTGLCRDHLRSIDPSNTVGAHAPLADVIITLTRRSHCFVTSIGGINGVITRAEIQKPIVRMWLFGILTVSELAVAAQVREQWPDDSWQQHVSPGRLQKARDLLAERQRNGQPSSLLECLQLPDKFLILASRPENLAALGLPTRGAAKQLLRELESLRNNLAHAQDIVTHDWAQIVRLSRRLVAVAEASR